MPEITKEELIASGIETVITHLMDNVLKKVLQTDPFIQRNIIQQNLFMQP